MNVEAQEMLKGILSKEPAALTEADIAFMRARRSYLSEEHLAVFAEVLGSEPTAEAPEASVEEAKKAKKAKKAK